MKTKTKTYVLLTLVLSIWGVIGYKIISATNPKSTEVVQHADVSFTPSVKKEADTFSIQTTNRDPFLETLLVKNRLKTQRLKPKTSLVWKPIVYHGIISNQNSKVKVFIISIDGQQYLIQRGQTINDIKLIRGHSKSVLLDSTP